MESISQANKLIQEIRKGNEHVIGELYTNYREPFLAWASKNFRLELEDSIDIFQESVIIFYRNVAKGKLIELSSSVKTYLFAIGKNLILRKLRDSKPLVEIEEKHFPNVSELNIFRDYENSNQTNLIKRALKKLGSPCDEILRMFYYRGFTMEIIKERLGYKSESVARTQKKRCMKYLKKLIAEKLQKD